MVTKDEIFEELDEDSVKWVEKAVNKGFDKQQVKDLLKDLDSESKNLMISYYNILTKEKEDEEDEIEKVKEKKKKGKKEDEKKRLQEEENEEKELKIKQDNQEKQEERKKQRLILRRREEKDMNELEQEKAGDSIELVVLKELEKRLDTLEDREQELLDRQEDIFANEKTISDWLEEEKGAREQQRKKFEEMELKEKEEEVERKKIFIEAKGKPGKRVTGKRSTGIINLDKVTGGGFEKHSTNLLIGGSGNGKSVFAIQFLMDGIRRGEKCLYITFEERKEEFYENIKELGWDLAKAEETGNFHFIAYTPDKIKDMLEEGGGEIETKVLKEGIQRISIDSITAFMMLFNNDLQRREAILSLFKLLRSWACTSLLTHERDPLVDKRSTSRVLEFESDSITLLYYLRIKKERERFLEIYKMRGSQHSKDIFSYIIEHGGIKLADKPFMGDLTQFKVA